MMIRAAGITIALLAYVLVFSMQERSRADTLLEMRHPMPSPIQEAALGYLRQLGGEIQFIKTAVFYGGVEPGRDPYDYAPQVAGRLAAAAELHPHFIDTYYLAQAILPYVDSDYAALANDIHRRGMAALPDNYALLFFIGFNNFYYLHDYAAAADYLHRASRHPGAPSWFGHLAATLAGRGGDIRGGLLWLEAMLAAEEDEYMRERYRHSIAMFHRAIQVLEAIEDYREKHGREPATLEELVPEQMEKLPEFDPPFRLSWDPPELRLLRGDQQ